MNFKKEIEKNIKFYGKKVTIVSKEKNYKGHCLFNRIYKNKEQYYNITEPDEIGLINCCKYAVWLVSSDKLKDIDSLICNDKKYDVIYEKYIDETGCFELIVVEGS